jgi:hypothetical protein
MNAARQLTGTRAGAPSRKSAAQRSREAPSRGRSADKRRSGGTRVIHEDGRERFCTAPSGGQPRPSASLRDVDNASGPDIAPYHDRQIAFLDRADRAFSLIPRFSAKANPEAAPFRPPRCRTDGLTLMIESGSGTSTITRSPFAGQTPNLHEKARTAVKPR